MKWLHESFLRWKPSNTLIRADSTKSDTKLCVPLVTWVNQDNIKALKQVELEFKRSVNSERYSAIRNRQSNYNKFNHFILLHSPKINGLLVWAFKGMTYRASISNCYILEAIIKN